MFYFSICLPRVLECLGFLLDVFRLFKSSVLAPYNVYASRIPKRGHKFRDGNPSFEMETLVSRRVRTSGSQPPDVRKVDSCLGFWCFQPFELPYLHLFKGGAFSSSEHDFAAQNSAILFSKVFKHTCNPLEPK